MRQTYTLKHDVEVRYLHDPDGNDTLLLPAGTEVMHDSYPFDQGTVHVITYFDQGDPYQAVRFVPAKGETVRQENPIYSNDPDRDTFDLDDPGDVDGLLGLYQRAEAERPDGTAPTYSDLDARFPRQERELVLYRSNSGVLARYVVVGHQSRRGLDYALIRPADWIGPAFRVDPRKIRPCPEGVVSPAPTVEDDNPFTATPGRPCYSVEVSQLDLVGNLWPKRLVQDADGDGTPEEYAFVGLDYDGEGGVTEARYKGASAYLLIVND